MAMALDLAEFRIFYQPVTDLATGDLVGTEALCRWPHRNDTTMTPDVFIPLAETSGFIVQLGEWALQTAVEQICLWQACFTSDLSIAVNLSGRQFSHCGLIPSIEAGSIGVAKAFVGDTAEALRQNATRVRTPRPDVADGDRQMAPRDVVARHPTVQSLNLPDIGERVNLANANAVSVGLLM